ncbi:hypothetical protein CPT_Muldoon_114 [Serratia phage Muldoon]|uniref:Uncharacterized protein n=1 Tax=Serratia phage Muldoon TaxID=2601678 RepID=A0A5P8PHB9_9CAUD|nr:hypothetical protein HYP94_gp113 [Serratia phage Muldoon]QFR56069.1 hypothetical protein CPT_Muldoon_114 [Serratia phage Muldoon]
MSTLNINDQTILGGNLIVSAESREAFGGWVDINIDWIPDDADDSEQSMRLTPTIEQTKNLIELLTKAVREVELQEMQDFADAITKPGVVAVE